MSRPLTSDFSVLHHQSERRLVTVLFIDIVNSSAIVKRHPYEAAEAIFTEILDRQAGICAQYGGTVNQIMGDGMMCLFGAAGASENHAFQAVSAAAAMLRDMEDIRRARAKDDLAVRIGINSGEVSLKSAAKEIHRAKFQAVGEPVHIADRIMKQARPNAMLLSESTARLAQKFFDFDKRADFAWEAGQPAIALFAPRGTADPYASGSADRKDGGKTETALRQQELQVLRQALRRGDAQGGSSFWIEAAAGYGKSFLLSALARELQGEGAFVSLYNFYPQPQVRSQSLQQFILGEALARIRPDDQAWVESPLASRLGREVVLAAMRDLLDADIAPSSPYLQLDRKSRVAACNIVLAALLGEAARQAPLVLAFEDMHWASTDERGLLQFLVQEHRGNAALKFIFTSREPYKAGKGASAVAQIALGSFSDTQAAGLLRLCGLDAAQVESFGGQLVRLTGGNPYFIKAYGDWLRRRLEAGGAPAELMSDLDAYTPNEITNILYAKTAGLRKPVMQVLKAASILGNGDTVERLSRASGLAPAECRRHIERLVKADIFQPAEDGGHWSFAHELLQKVIYNSIPPALRRAGHLAALRLAGGGDALQRRLRAAFHARQARLGTREYVYLKWAGQAAGRVSRHNDAIEYYMQAERVLLRTSMKEATRRNQLLALKLLQVEGLFIASRYKAVKSRLDFLLKQRRYLPPARLRHVKSFQGLYYWVNGKIEEARDIYATLLKNTVPAQKEDFVRESARLSHICIDLGAYGEGAQYARRALDCIDEGDYYKKMGLLTEVGPTLYSCLALAQAHMGESAAARASLARASAALAGSRDYFTRIYTLFFVAKSLIVMQDHAAARPLLEEAIADCAKINSSLLEPCVLSAYGLVLAREGDCRQGLVYGEKAIRIAHDSDLKLRRSLFNIWYGEILHIAGRHREAIKFLRRGLKNAFASGEKGRIDQAHRLIEACYRALGAPPDLLGAPADIFG